EHGPAVGDAECDAGPGGEGGRAGGPDRDAQASRGGEDGLAGAAGGEGECRAADVRDSATAADLRGGAGAAGERAPAAVEDRPAVLSLGRAGRGRADAAGKGVPTHAPPAHVSPEVQGLPSLQGTVFGV